MYSYLIPQQVSSINENADPDVVRDVMYALERAVSPNEGF